MKKVILNGKEYGMDVVALYMDTEIREELHNSGRFDAGEEQGFVDAYVLAHKAKFNEDFEIN